MWTYYNPVDVHAGCGSLDSLPRLLGARRAILIAFPEAVGLGLVDRIRGLLGERLAAVETEVLPNPDVAWLAPMYERLWREHAEVDCVIALGGGSVIDCAKVMLTRPAAGRFDELLALLEGADSAPASVRRHRQLLAIPTTAGTGSEVTPWATVWDQARARKLSLQLPWTWPEAAIVDADLMLSLPHAATLASGLDALSHALEAIWNVNANALSDTFAVAAVQQIFETLPLLMEKLDDLDLRARMALAALQAGMAFSNTRTALAHSISYEMTLRYGLPHGIACSFPLPMVLRRAIGQDAGRDAVLERALGPLDRAPQRLSDFIERLGVKTHFSDYGVSSEQADRMVAHALTGARGKNFIGTVHKETA